MPRPKKTVNPAFTPCIEIYNTWFKGRYPYPPTFNSRQGKCMNEILKTLGETIKNKQGEYPTVEELIASFKLVLDKHDNWGFWKGKIFHLHQINDKLIEILEEIRNNNGAGKQQQAVDAYNSIKDL